MILLITDAYGKISAGASASERGKGKSALALRPFTLGRYRLSRKGAYVNIVEGETIHSYYGFASDYDKFIEASLLLEWTGKIMPEDMPSPEIFKLLSECLELMDARKRAFRTLTVSYMVQVLKLSGLWPESQNFKSDELLSGLDFDIVNALAYLSENPLNTMKNLALDDGRADVLKRIVMRYAEWHLDVGNLKSDKV